MDEVASGCFCSRASCRSSYTSAKLTETARRPADADLLTPPSDPYYLLSFCISLLLPTLVQRRGWMRCTSPAYHVQPCHTQHLA